MYYKVAAIHGHVGAGKESYLVFAIEADSAYSAMKIARSMPMVKHSRLASIKSVELITEDEYIKLREKGAYRHLKDDNTNAI